MTESGKISDNAKTVTPPLNTVSDEEKGPKRTFLGQ